MNGMSYQTERANTKENVRPARKALRALTRLFVPPHQPKRPSRKVAIVVPLSTRPALLPEEEVSLRHLRHFLGAYDKYLIAPAGASIQRDGFNTVHFPRKFFGSLAAHARMGFWPPFYEAFQDYEYILIYHLDALVFSDELMQWCDAGWDYIGAPWLPCSDTPWVKQPAVGNGGFALMKVESSLRALNNRYRDDPLTYWADLLTSNGHRLTPVFRMLETLKRRFPDARVVQWPLERWEKSENPARYGLNNDFFWAFHAVRYLPSFKVAPVDAALQFAFEGSPRMCFELNQQRLPFGCHAWAKYDRAFWEQFLLRGSEGRMTTA